MINMKRITNVTTAIRNVFVVGGINIFMVKTVLIMISYLGINGTIEYIMELPTTKMMKQK